MLLSSVYTCRSRFLDTHAVITLVLCIHIHVHVERKENIAKLK